MRFETICDCGRYLIFQVPDWPDYSVDCLCGRHYQGTRDRVDRSFKLYWRRLKFHLCHRIVNLRWRYNWYTKQERKILDMYRD